MSYNYAGNPRALVNTHGNLSDDLAKLSLAQAYARIGGDRQSSIPFLVWLLENPASPLALAGKIYLRERDYLHLLLGRGFSATDEVYVIGFTMGNDMETKQWHVWLYKVVSLLIYPPQFRLTKADLREFDKGLARGRSLPIKNLNKLDFTDYRDWQLSRSRVGLKLAEAIAKR